MIIEGEYTDADVKGREDMFDEAFFEQVQDIVDHEAFQNDIVIQPDGHAGAGAVIGFTMPIGERITPNVVGSDIGCGVTAFKLGQVGHLNANIDSERFWNEVDMSIREAVPMGFGKTHDGTDYHLVRDFPWYMCNHIRHQFGKKHGYDFSDFPEYGEEYFKDLCERVGIDINRAINSMGTLGAGNHFLEISKSDKTGEFWAVVHSGSRGPGGAISSHWQDRASELTEISHIRDSIEGWMWEYVKFYSDDDDSEIHQWVHGGKGEAFYDMEKIREDFDGEEIEERRQALVSVIPDDNRKEALDYLEGDNALGYITDMIFAQQYARENRLEMLYSVADVLSATIEDQIDSIHNYIDFRDGVIRKGATKAKKGMPLIIPFNMAEGAVICTGRGNEDYNDSAPHGAGRRGSRTWAYDEFDMDQFEEEMEGVHSNSISEETLDEIPSAYKDSEDIMEFLTETADVREHLTPVLNMKGE